MTSLQAFTIDEESDAFPTSGPTRAFHFDIGALNMVSNSARPGPPSVATTELASVVGSVVGRPRDAFLKGMTFGPDSEWAVEFVEGGEIGGIFKKRVKPRLYVDTVGGVFTASRIQNGDYLRTINGEKVAYGTSPEEATQRMKEALEKDGILSISTANKNLGNDILVQATIIKPSEETKFEDMGMVVWFWGYLCVREIDPEGFFSHTVLRPTDHIVSINDIECENLRPAQFATIFDGLEREVTITVLRRKQRWGGSFD
eukprot:Nitzschia sp. Nitz4//scaffold39_size137210//34410//35183//NITZ4_003193-RA/size137210-processed-gene-0.56-mRNA-1//-1//CDS//3329550365//1930//frame0